MGSTNQRSLLRYKAFTFGQKFMLSYPADGGGGQMERRMDTAENDSSGRWSLIRGFDDRTDYLYAHVHFNSNVQKRHSFPNNSHPTQTPVINPPTDLFPPPPPHSFYSSPHIHCAFRHGDPFPQLPCPASHPMKCMHRLTLHLPSPSPSSQCRS